MQTYRTRLFNTDINIIKFGSDIRLDTTLGTPYKREDIRYMFGAPNLDEVTALRFNLSFFNTGSSVSEEMGVGRGDPFVNVAYDGSKLYFEPNIPSYKLWEVPSAYMLLRDGQYDNTGESGLKAITGSNPRTMWGQDAKGNIYAMIAEGRRIGQKGLTANEQRSSCMTIGLEDAVNADGGGSSVAFIYDQKIGRIWDGRKHGRIIVGYAKYNLNQLPLIKKGFKGVYVNLLQRLLGISADGQFSTGTRTAVMNYQKQKGLKVDGIVGQHTWNALTRR